MKLGKYSKAKIAEYHDGYDIAHEYWGPSLNYLLHGFEPGSFFTSMFANDMMGALSHSHPANSISGLKNLALWIRQIWPKESYGSYEKVAAWVSLSDEERRDILVKDKLIYSEEEEIMKALKGERVNENFFGLDFNFG